MNDIHVVEEAASTNDLARQAACGGAPSGTAFRAVRQTAGRGRLGRSWVSRSGDLFLSVVLRPAIPAAHVASITLAAAVAVRSALTGHGVEGGLKWPNDIVVGGRKLSGILVEGVVDGESLNAVVVGIGVNVALEVDRLESPLRETATSFASLGLPLPSLDRLAEDVRDALVGRAAGLAAGGLPGILDEWRTHNVILAERVTWSGPDGPVHGTAVDIARDGGLELRLDDGRTVVARSGEVVTVDGLPSTIT